MVVELKFQAIRSSSANCTSFILFLASCHCHWRYRNVTGAKAKDIITPYPTLHLIIGRNASTKKRKLQACNAHMHTIVGAAAPRRECVGARRSASAYLVDHRYLASCEYESTMYCSTTILTICNQDFTIVVRSRDGVHAARSIDDASTRCSFFMKTL